MQTEYGKQSEANYPLNFFFIIVNGNLPLHCIDHLCELSEISRYYSAVAVVVAVHALMNAVFLVPRESCLLWVMDLLPVHFWVDTWFELE